MLAVAILALMAAANPKGAEIRLYGLIELMSDQRFFWFCVAFVVAYAALWWATAGEPRSRRERLKEGLRPHYELTAAQLRAVEATTTDQEFEALEVQIEAKQRGIFEWINNNMGGAAVAKFVAVSSALRMVGRWHGEHDPEIEQRRNRYMSGLRNRRDNLEALLESDSWDGSAPTLLQRIKDRWTRNRNSTVS